MSANDDSCPNKPQTSLSLAQELKSHRIRHLNDRLRKTGQGGLIIITREFSALDADLRSQFLNEIALFNDFHSDNDPYGEHDLGKVTIGSESALWKIEYYDIDMAYASTDPSDSNITSRVLTIMMATEY